MESLSLMEIESKTSLEKFSSSANKFSDLYNEKLKRNDTYLSNISDYISYCEQAKETLKIRDQKQIDYQDLKRYLDASISERDKTTLGSVGLTGFFINKMNDFKGIDPEKTRLERLNQLNNKIVKLESDVASALQTSTNFSQHVQLEIINFENQKNQEFKQFFKDFIDSQIKFHESSIDIFQ